jgi:uncharacterized protein (DUF1778 family)
MATDNYKGTEAQKDAVKRYQAGRDAIMLRPSKDEGREIRQAAADAGESLQGFILGAVRARMDSYLSGAQDAAQPTPEGTESI